MVHRISNYFPSIQIQHLLKLNVAENVSLCISPDSNTTLVKVKLGIDGF